MVGTCLSPSLTHSKQKLKDSVVSFATLCQPETLNSPLGHRLGTVGSERDAFLVEFFFNKAQLPFAHALTR